MKATAPAGLSQARILFGAIVAGALLFVAIVWLFVRPEASAEGPGGLTPAIAGYIWLAVTATAVPAALFFQRRATERVEQFRRSPGGGGDPRAAMAAMQTQLVVSWALFESTALIAGVLLLLYGPGWYVWAGVVVFLLGMWLSFPRSAWYEPYEGAARTRRENLT